MGHPFSLLHEWHLFYFYIGSIFTPNIYYVKQKNKKELSQKTQPLIYKL